ncbi:MAG: hypothetical protein IKR23_08990 [Lachnospiraceae bacterium]|nr:hypothetical protein [Lachnospiraceae bacterium]
MATVAQDGTVTAVAKGKAKITAYINGCAYNCNVTVKESVTPLERRIVLYWEKNWGKTRFLPRKRASKSLKEISQKPLTMPYFLV